MGCLVRRHKSALQLPPFRPPFVISPWLGIEQFLDIVTQKYSSTNFATLDRGLPKSAGKPAKSSPILPHSSRKF